MPAANGLPILWQLQISHYNEKVRWALDHKRIDHVRRSLLPGLHILVARRLSGGSTTLVGDSFTVADLTAASLLYPLVPPPEFPYPTVTVIPEPGREFVQSLADRPALRWVSEMYAPHRAPVGAVVVRRFVGGLSR